jgi:uncharacterized protein YbbK (DUF523 family)/uncharacterized protein YbgA (DUF1722 family)
LEIAARAFVKPVVFVSRCLGFAACRYDGVATGSDLVEAMRPHVEFRAVCPEMAIGLGVPRERIRIVRAGRTLRLVQPATGRDLTNSMTRFAELRLTPANGFDGFILKSRSPSCGISDAKRYSRADARDPVGRGAGFFAAAALRKFPDLPIEDEARLADRRLREHFLTRLFTQAAFEEVARTRLLKLLVQFQAENEKLLEAHSRKDAGELRRIVANRERRSLDALLPDYRARLARALARPARPGSNVRALRRAMESLSKPLTARERARFLAALEKYRAGKLPLSAPRRILRGWIAKNPDQKLLARQTFFEPYPKELDAPERCCPPTRARGRRIGRAAR